MTLKQRTGSKCNFYAGVSMGILKSFLFLFPHGSESAALFRGGGVGLENQA